MYTLNWPISRQIVQLNRSSFRAAKYTNSPFIGHSSRDERSLEPFSALLRSSFGTAGRSSSLQRTAPLLLIGDRAYGELSRVIRT